MLRAAALATVVLFSGSVVASAAPAPITEIGLAQCHEGYEYPRGDPLVAFVLTPDGRVLRATAPMLPDGTGGAPVFERADIGTDAYRALAHQIGTATFFELSHAQTAVVISDTRGTRISAVRASRRMTWASDGHPSDRHAMIDAVLGAIYDRTRDPRLVWIPATAKTHPFALCSEPVQWDAFRN